MNPNDDFARICDVAADFKRGDRSLIDVVRTSGYADLRGRFATPELAEYLRPRPEIIETWVDLSANKRTSEGWYLRPPYSIGRISRDPPVMHEVKHVDLAAACAAFIVAELGEILDLND